MQTTISISEARKKIFEITTEVQKPDAYCVLTENGRPKAVIISASDFASWQETLEVAKDFPHLQQEKTIAENEYKKGDYITLEEFLAKNGYLLKKPNTKTSHVPTRSTKKSAKRNSADK